MLFGGYISDDFASYFKRSNKYGKWKRNYIDPYILDGTQWELEIYFAGDRKPLKISGSNAYPYNFSDLIALLGIDEEEPEEEQD